MVELKKYFYEFIIIDSEYIILLIRKNSKIGVYVV